MFAASVALLVTLQSATLQAAEVSAYGTLATEYIYRGLAMSDRNPALQLGADVEINDSLFAGAWFSTVDLSSASGGRDIETNLYVGYHHSYSEKLSSTVTFLRYGYPGAGGRHSYDHNEAVLTLAWDARYALEYAYTDNVYGLGRRATHLLLSADWPLQNGWVLGANAGRNDLSHVGLSDYLHGNIGLSARIARVTFDVRIYETGSIDNARLEHLTAGTRLTFSLSAAF